MNRARTLKSLALSGLCGISLLLSGCAGGDGLSLGGSSSGPSPQASDGSLPTASPVSLAGPKLDPIAGAVLTKNSPSSTSASVLWRDPQSAKVAIWRLDAQGAVVGASSIAFISPEWEYRGNGDFNGDGWPDILWQRKDTRSLALWMLNDNQVVSQATLPTPSSGWSCIGVADFNRDGAPDVLWQNSASGAVAYWSMNRNLGVAGATSMGTSPGAPWTVRAVADLRRDGAADVVWQNGNQLRIWNWGGSSMTEVVNTGLPANMEVRASQDFNGDGYADLLLQNPTNQETGFLRLNWSGRTVYQKLANANPAWNCLGGLAAPAETSPRINLTEGNGGDSVLTVLLPGVPSQPKSVQWTIANTVVKSGTPIRQFFPLGGSYQIQADVVDAQSNRLQLVSNLQVRGRSSWPCPGGNAQGNCRSWVDTSANEGQVRSVIQLAALNPRQDKGNSTGSNHGIAVGPDGTIYTCQGNQGTSNVLALVALNPDLSIRWTFNLNDIGIVQADKSCFCVTEDGTVYLGVADHLVALNADGSLKWKYFAGSSFAVGEMKAALDGRLYVLMHDGWVYCFEPTDGSVRYGLPNLGGGSWVDQFLSVDLTPQGTIDFGGVERRLDTTLVYSYDGSAGGPTNFCYGEDGYRYSVALTNSRSTVYKAVVKGRQGVQAWLWDPWPELGAPFTALTGDAPKVGLGPDGSVYALTGSGNTVNGSMVSLTSNGKFQWVKYFDGPSLTCGRVFNPLIAAEGTIYVAWERGELYAFNPDGTQRWVFRPGQYLAGSPAVGPDGSIYVKSYDGHVYALH